MRFPALVMAMVLGACVRDSAQSTPNTIVVGVLPDRTNISLALQYEPLVDYLETTTGLSISLLIPSSYAELVDDFAADRIQLAFFGGLTFVQAEQSRGAQPLVMRDVDLRFTSCYLVSASDQRRKIDEFAGEEFSFGPVLSTSGHLMPRYFLTKSEIVPEKLFGEVRHSSAHDATAKWVADGTVKIGVANCNIVRSMFEEGRLDPDQVRILETTPPYVDYVWAVQEYLDESLVNQLRDAFMALDATNPAHRAALHANTAGGYLPAGRDDFEDVRVAARAANLINEARPK